MKKTSQSVHNLGIIYTSLVRDGQSEMCPQGVHYNTDVYVYQLADNGNNNDHALGNHVYRARQQESCTPYRGGFSMGDKFLTLNQWIRTMQGSKLLPPDLCETRTKVTIISQSGTVCRYSAILVSWFLRYWQHKICVSMLSSLIHHYDDRVA